MKDALVGALVGAGLAWLLGLGTLIIRDRRAARSAARMIYFELSANGSDAVAARWSGLWRGIRRQAFDAYGEALLRTAGLETLRTLYAAYYAVEALDTIIGSARNPDEVLAAAKQGLFDQYIANIEEGERAVAKAAGIPAGIVERGLRAVHEHPRS